MNRTFYRLQLLLSRCQKYLRSFFLKTKRYHKLSISEHIFNDLRHHRMFIAAIQLSRMTNAILSCGRTFLRIPDNGRLVNFNDKLEMLLLNGSVLYEGVLEFRRLSKRLKQLHAWRENNATIDFINKQVSNKASLFNTVLKTVRNEAIFHFEEQMIIDAVANLELAKRTDFAVASGPKYDDFVYTLPTNILLKYITEKSQTNMPSEALYQELIDYTAVLATKLIDVSTEMLVELLGSITTRTTGPLET